MKAGKFRKLIGIIIVLCGIGIFLYPIINQAYAAKKQNELRAAFEELLAANQLSEADSTISTPIISAEPTQVLRPSTTPILETQDIALDEVEDCKETQSVDNIKDRLDGQVLVGLIEIEKIDLIYAIVEGTEDWNLGVAVGHMTNTAAIGENGNCAIAGHRGGTSGPYFKYINKLDKGDEIKVTDTNGNVFLYHVTESFVVDPTDVWVADTVNEDKLLTLITCQENGTKRLIVRAICE